MEKKKPDLQYFKKIIDMASDSLTNFTYPKYSAESTIREAKLTRDELQTIVNPSYINDAIKLLGEKSIKVDSVDNSTSELVVLFATLDSLSESISNHIENTNAAYNLIEAGSGEGDEDESLPESVVNPEILILHLLNTWLGTSDMKEVNRIVNKFSWSNEVGVEVEKLLKSIMIKHEFINMFDTLNLTKAIEYLQKACEYLPNDTDEEKVRKDTLKEFIAERMHGLAPVDADKETEQLKSVERPKDSKKTKGSDLSMYQ